MCKQILQPKFTCQWFTEDRNFGIWNWQTSESVCGRWHCWSCAWFFFRGMHTSFNFFHNTIAHTCCKVKWMTTVLLMLWLRGIINNWVAIHLTLQQDIWCCHSDIPIGVPAYVQFHHPHYIICYACQSYWHQNWLQKFDSACQTIG